MQARQYRPDTGRFLSQDRYEAAGAGLNVQADPLTQNRYAFAGAKPINNIEFDGHEPIGSFNPNGEQIIKGNRGRSAHGRQQQQRCGCNTSSQPPRRPPSTSKSYSTTAKPRSVHIGPRGVVVRDRSSGFARGVDGGHNPIDLTGPARAAQGAFNFAVGDPLHNPIDAAALIPPLKALKAPGWLAKLRRPGTSDAANPVPGRVARVVEERVGRRAKTLGAPGQADVFVTNADDVAGLFARQIARRLSLYDDVGNPRSGPFSVFEFDTPLGIASPIRRSNPGFTGRGRTAGGAAEFAAPNSRFSQLRNLHRRTAR